MSLTVLSAAAPASHRGRHRRPLTFGGVVRVAVAAAAITLVIAAAPVAGFVVTVLGLP